MAEKEVVIIGSGVGGSAVGALLAQTHEYRVTLLEKSRLIGGRFATYDKEGFKLDVGCHMLANCDKGRLGRVLDICGCSDYVKWNYARKPSPVVFYQGERLRFPFEAHKLGFTGADLENLLRMHRDIMSFTPEDYERYETVSIREFVSRYMDSELAQSMMGFFSAINFVTRDDETPISEYALCQKEISVNKALGYPTGGTGAVPEAYCRIIEEHGGRVMTGAAVDHIVVEDGRAAGVVLNDGRRLAADLVISNASIKETVSGLVDESHYPAEFLEKVRGYRYSFNTHAIKIALDEPISDDTMILYVGRRDMNEAERLMEEKGELPDKATHLMIPIISNLDPESAPEGRQLLIAGGSSKRPHTAGADTWRRWEAAMTAALEDVWPDIRKHILWTVTTSAEDINHFVGEEGCVIGIGQTIGQVGPDRPPLVDPHVGGLYHCSADTGMHGIGGELAADSALRLYELLV
ncbi:MAG: NAD(P)/FAD-dependent oxidoreductase [Proteobacteria bacterium]|nr:NAD(P)/FAD-dependent oxidoreductase [Pseudomonadota bacterium]